MKKLPFKFITALFLIPAWSSQAFSDGNTPPFNQSPRILKIAIAVTPRFQEINQDWRKTIEKTSDVLAKKAFSEGLQLQIVKSFSWSPQKRNDGVIFWTASELANQAVSSFPSKQLDAWDSDFMIILGTRPSADIFDREMRKIQFSINPPSDFEEMSLKDIEHFASADSTADPHLLRMASAMVSEATTIGESELLSRWLVVTLPEEDKDPQAFQYILMHEIGHQFGCVHVPKKYSIMYPKWNQDDAIFDVDNWEILNLMKDWYDFRKGVGILPDRVIDQYMKILEDMWNGGILFKIDRVGNPLAIYFKTKMKEAEKGKYWASALIYAQQAEKFSGVTGSYSYYIDKYFRMLQQME